MKNESCESCEFRESQILTDHLNCAKLAYWELNCRSAEDKKFPILPLIQVFDHVNDHTFVIEQSRSVITHPHSSIITIDAYRRKDYVIWGIIFHSDGSTEVFSRNKKNVQYDLEKLNEDQNVFKTEIAKLKEKGSFKVNG